MKGDFSRQTFRPEKHYSGVRMQQGRAHLDADWNEQVDIESHRDAATAIDVIGPVGAPFHGGGFAISAGSFMRAVALVDAAKGWAVGARGAILRTTDKGASWTLEPPPAGVGNLNAVAVVSAKDVWAVGDGGAVAHFDGSSWSAGTVAGVNPALRGIHFFDAKHGWAVGDEGTVLVWNGSDWTPRTVPELTGALRAVHFADDTSGWAVGDAGAVVMTADGGDTWSALSVPPGTPDLRSVHFTGTSAGCAVGVGGTILTTADGGATWTARSVTGVSATLSALCFDKTGKNGWAVGHDATVLATADGGHTWAPEEAAAGSPAHLTGVAVFGATRLTCGENVILRRGTGSVGWERQPLPAQGRDLVISAGDIYVDGVRCENERPVSFTWQPDLPGVLPDSPAAPELHGAYLIRREEHLTAIEREDIREVALRGPDTSTRTRVSWHVHLTGPLADDSCTALASALPSAGGAGLLRARAEPVEVPTSECTVSPSGGYRRLENQLYRVEIHDPGPIDPGSVNGHATYKWSRDNGSMLARLEELDPAGLSVGVSTTGRDDVLGFASEQWVEVTDESRARRGLPGILLEVDNVEGKKLDVVSIPPKPGGGSWSMADFPVNPTVRRWDGQGDVTDDWDELEEGVQVEFGSGPFEAGDFWTVPARTITGSVEWPAENGDPAFRRAEGGTAGLAALGVVRALPDGTWEGVRDCRPRFPALTSLTELHYVGGDGQEVMPDSAAPQSRVQLPQPLEVGVANWRWPVTGARVRFTVSTGSGTLDGQSATQVIVPTNAQGIASCAWFVDGSTVNQRVEAFLLDEDDLPVQTPVHFGANLSIAAEVAYDPGGCAGLAAAKTVQSAIAHLASSPRLEKAGGDDQEVMPGEALDSIQVRVVSECGPVEGARVQFVVVDDAPAGGTLNGQRNIVVGPTPSDGVVGASWALGDGRGTQYVVAVLLDVDGVAVPQPAPSVRFAATLSTADHVSYEPPAGCVVLKDDDTVQEAIDRLIGMASLYRLRGDGQRVTPAAAANLRPLEVLVASGCGPVKGASVQFRVRQGKGRLQGQQGPVVIDTDDDGIASCDWDLETRAPSQLVEARLIKLPETHAGVVIQPPALTEFIAHLDAEDVQRPAARASMVAAGELPDLPPGSWIDVPIDTVEYATAPEMHDGVGLRVPTDGIYLVTGQVTWSGDVTAQLELTASGGDRRIAFGRTAGSVVAVATTALLREGDAVHARAMHFDRRATQVIQGGEDRQNMTLTWLSTA